MGANANLMLATSSGSQAIAGIGASYSQAQAQKAQTYYQEKSMQFNADAADYQAKEAIARGEREANQAEVKARMILGAQRVAAAGQGVQVDVGTAASLQDETEAMAAIEAMNARNNAWMEAWGYKSQAVSSRSSAEFARISGDFSARNTMITGAINAGTKGLEAAGYYGKWRQDQKDPYKRGS